MNQNQVQCKAPNRKFHVKALNLRGWNTDRNKVEGEPGIAEQFWPILRTLHFMGSAPVHIKHGKSKLRNHGKFYYFNFWSPYTVLSLCMALIYTFLWIKYTVELGFDQTFMGDSFQKSKEYFRQFTRTKDESSPLTNNAVKMDSQVIVSLPILMRIMFFIFPMEHILSLVFSWWDAPLLIQFLNKWHPIEMTYALVFCSKKNNNEEHKEEVFKQILPMVDLRKWRNWFITFYVAVPTLIFWPLNINASVHWDDSILVVVIIFSSFHFVIYPMLDAAKTVLLYKVMAEAFYKVKKEMSQTMKRSSVVDPMHVRSCRQLLEMIRKQCRLLGKLQTKQELLQLAGSFTVLTCDVYIIFNGDYSHKNSLKVLTVITLFSTWIFTTIIIKATVADQITDREREIAEMLASAEPDWLKLDPIVESESKFIHDMILLHPSTISLGNYIVYNKKLILTIFSQIATYIIVLMQLSSSRK